MGRISFFALIYILGAFPSFAQQIYITKTGKVNFVSDAPLELIKATSTELQGALNPGDKSFAFVIDNKTFKGFNSPLQQEHFYENYMEVQDYPTSSFKGKIIEDIDMQSVSGQTVRAKGVLTIHGVEQERIIKGTLLRTREKFILKAEFTVPLEEHNIKIPKVVYQKIAEIIQVNIEAELIIKTQ
jgi:hypothetical protein